MATKKKALLDLPPQPDPLAPLDSPRLLNALQAMQTELEADLLLRGIALDDLSLPAEVRLMEQPTFKRRWLFTDWTAGVEEARRTEFLGRCEGRCMAEVEVRSGRFLASGLDETGPVAQWIGEDAVPYLAAYRHTESGLEKRTQWEHVWDLQRAEDRGDKVASFDPASKYDSKDYRDPIYWRLRGKLDVSKERFISYPGCESAEDKGGPVYGWAGWNHLQQAQALAALYQKSKTEESWDKERLTPVLAGVLELLPWVKQWHNEPSEEFGGLRLGDYIEEFVDSECHGLGLTREDLRGWRPAERKGRKKKG